MHGRFQQQVEQALQDAGGDRDLAAKVKDAVAEAARSQGSAGVSSAIQVQLSALPRGLCSVAEAGAKG